MSLNTRVLRRNDLRRVLFAGGDRQKFGPIVNLYNDNHYSFI
jgi:hypothetical protein